MNYFSNYPACQCGCHSMHVGDVICACYCNKNVSPLIEQIQKLENKIKELESSKARADIVAQEYIKIMERIDRLEKKEQIEYKIDRISELEKIISDYIRSNNHVVHEITDRVVKLEDKVNERANLINYKSYLALSDRISKL